MVKTFYLFQNKTITTKICNNNKRSFLNKIIRKKFNNNFLYRKSQKFQLNYKLLRYNNSKNKRKIELIRDYFKRKVKNNLLRKIKNNLLRK